MKRTKLVKILFSLLALLLCISILASCSSDTEPDNGSDEVVDIPDGGDNPGDDNPGGNNPDGDNPDGDNPSGGNPGGDAESHTVTIKVIGGMLHNGKTEDTFELGDTVTITAFSTEKFECWENSAGEVVSNKAGYSFTVTAESISDVFTAIYDETDYVSDFDDFSAGTIISKTNMATGDMFVRHEQRADGSTAVIVADPRGEGNVLKFSKTDKTTGDTVFFTPINEGNSCFVLEFDLCFVSNTCSIPLQINLGSSYRLQFHVSNDHVLIYDAKSDGSEKHYIGGIMKYGEWTNIRVEYYPGDMTEGGQYAKVYFDGKLTAISQNSFSKTISKEYTRASFYSLIASDATLYIDNVSAYSTNDEFEDSDEEIIRINHGQANNDEWENRFMFCEIFFGKEITEELKKICALFDDDVYIWLANLYDPLSGGFYYSNDARDYDGFLADVESTAQAISLISNVGLGSVNDIFTDEMKARLVAWVQSLQSDDDGYFYHPQWGRDIGTGRLSRDLGWSISILNRFDAEPLYPTALDRLANGGSRVSLTSSLMLSKESAVSDVIAVSVTTTAPQLASEEAFIAYLDNLYATMLATADDGTTVPNSYNIGGTVSSQASQIKAAGLADICIQYFNEKQNPETGLWEADKNYRSASGLLKISSMYNSLGAEIPNADKTVRSAIDIATSERPLTTIVYVYNPLAGLSNTLTNLKKYSTAENSEEIRQAVYNEMRSRAIELITNTYSKLSAFKKADGSFSYNVSGAPAHSQGELVCFGANEGDVNGTALANGTISSLFSVMGVSRPACYNEKDAEIFAQLVRTREPIVKQSANDVLIDFESIEAETGLPKFVTASAASEGASYSIVTDTVFGKETEVFSLNSTKGKNDTLTVKFPSSLENISCYALSFDIAVTPGKENETTHLAQIKLGSAYMITLTYTRSTNTINVTDASSTGAGNITTNLGISVKPGEWFNLSVEYYVGDADLVCILIYLNGELAAISNNYYGSKVNGQPLPAPANTVTSVYIQSLMAAVVEMRFDNIHIAALDKTLADVIPEKITFDGMAEGSVPDNITNSISSGGSASVAYDGDNGYLKIISESGSGDTTSVSPSFGLAESKKYVFTAKMHYLRSNNTTTTQLFFMSGISKCFALDISYSNGLISIYERTSAGSGEKLISNIDGTASFELTVEYYPEIREASIKVVQGEKTLTATTTAYYSDSTNAQSLSSISIYSLKSAQIELHIDDLGVYSIFSKV